jgi:hypothetical protein
MGVDYWYHVPASITWEQDERNRTRRRANRARAEAIGAVRAGAALRTGVATRGFCG